MSELARTRTHGTARRAREDPTPKHHRAGQQLRSFAHIVLHMSLLREPTPDRLPEGAALCASELRPVFDVAFGPEPSLLKLLRLSAFADVKLTRLKDGETALALHASGAP